MRIPTRKEKQEGRGQDKKDPPPVHVMGQGKMDRSDAQQKRWLRNDQQALKALFEEFGHTPFTLDDADECGYLDMMEHEAISVMSRLVERGWYDFEGDDEYAITSEGEAEYDRLN